MAPFKTSQCLFVASLLACSTPVLAQTPFAPESAPPLSIAINAGAASDYVFRGVDQTGGRAEGFGGLDLGYRDVYVGTWASNVDLRRFGDARASAEVDAYGGWRPSLHGYDLDIGVISYAYVDAAERENHIEAYGKVSRAIGPFNAAVSVYASPRNPRAAGAGAYIEGKASYDLTRKLTVSATLGGQYETHAVAPAPCLPTAAGCAAPYGDLSYVDWTLGSAYALTDHIGLDLRYSDTGARTLGVAYHTRIVLSARASFP